MPLPPLAEAMLEPGFYPHRPARVELRQTHISFVFLAGDEVYKVKKPVKFTFLDFSTLERRRRFCHEEVELNRRLAADVYLGVVGIRSTGAGFSLADATAPDVIEYAVHMRRLDEADTLEQRLARGSIEPDEIAALAEQIVDFHRRASASDEITANGEPAAILRVLQDNYDGVAPFRGDTIDSVEDDAIQSFARAFLRDQHALLARRRHEHRIRDGHGDLKVDHIYLTMPPRIVDCVEFNPRFRWCDVASDLAFLFMDLEFHGRADLAALLVDTYVERSGDRELRRLLFFYACYRAYVRGKVATLKSAEEEVEPTERAQARNEARARFALARRYSFAALPRLVVVAGLSGTGKSSVARALAERTGFALIASDEVRKQLAGVPPTARLSGAQQARLYSARMSARTYDELFARAAQALAAGRGAILDATFQQRRGRGQARELAARVGVPFVLLECRASDDVVHRRLTERARRNDDPSDADWAVYLEQKHRAEPLLASEGAAVLDADRPLAEVVTQSEQALQ